MLQNPIGRLTQIRSSLRSLSLHTIAGKSPIDAWSRVADVCPLPSITAEGGLGIDWISCASTVDLRRKIASAPESKRADLAKFAAHDSGPASASQAEWSRHSSETPRRASSLAMMLATNARVFFLPPLSLAPGGCLLLSTLGGSPEVSSAAALPSRYASRAMEMIRGSSFSNFAVAG